jgi:hypothetical protein
MYACIPEIGGGFFEGCASMRLGYILVATHPPRPHALYWNQVRTAKSSNHPRKLAA